MQRIIWQKMMKMNIKKRKKKSNPSSHALKSEIDMKGKGFQCMPGITVGIRSLSKSA